MSRHASTRHEDSCSLACGPHADGTTCATYDGRHRLSEGAVSRTFAERLVAGLAPYVRRIDDLVLGEQP